MPFHESFTLWRKEVVSTFLYDYRHIYGDQAQYFEMEVSPRIKHTKAGMVSMVNNGNNMHGSQVRVFSTTKTNTVDVTPFFDLHCMHDQNFICVSL